MSAHGSTAERSALRCGGEPSTSIARSATGRSDSCSPAMWASSIDSGTERLIAYEAHAQAGFFAAPVIGLCLYHRRRLPLHVLNGALLTHPLTTAARGHAMANPFYDGEVAALPSAHDREVTSKLHALTNLTRRSVRRR